MSTIGFEKQILPDYKRKRKQNIKRGHLKTGKDELKRKKFLWISSQNLKSMITNPIMHSVIYSAPPPVFGYGDTVVDKSLLLLRGICMEGKK